jgi:hypothetical protein
MARIARIDVNCNHIVGCIVSLLIFQVIHASEFNEKTKLASLPYSLDFDSFLYGFKPESKNSFKKLVDQYKYTKTGRSGAPLSLANQANLDFLFYLLPEELLVTDHEAYDDSDYNSNFDDAAREYSYYRRPSSLPQLFEARKDVTLNPEEVNDALSNLVINYLLSEMKKPDEDNGIEKRAGDSQVQATEQTSTEKVSKAETTTTASSDSSAGHKEVAMLRPAFDVNKKSENSLAQAEYQKKIKANEVSDMILYIL